jgi:hypothetical protein
MAYKCNTCDYELNNKSSLEKHNKSSKHKIKYLESELRKSNLLCISLIKKNESLTYQNMDLEKQVRKLKDELNTILCDTDDSDDDSYNEDLYNDSCNEDSGVDSDNESNNVSYNDDSCNKVLCNKVLCNKEDDKKKSLQSRLAEAFRKL